MNKKHKRTKQTAVLYNQLINFFWSTLAFVPIVYFCYQYLPLKLLYIFAAISCLVIFLPTSIISKLQLSQSPEIYKKTGIRFIKKYTQDGDLVNRFIRNQHPQYKYVENRQAIKKLITRSYMNEKFHYIIFVFFICITIYAIISGLIGWVIFISTANIVYNLYPIFLQQYNRIRINNLLKK